MGRNSEETAQKILEDYAEQEADGTAASAQDLPLPVIERSLLTDCSRFQTPKKRLFADASEEVKRAVGESLDFTGAPPQSRCRGTSPKL